MRPFLGLEHPRNSTGAWGVVGDATLLLGGSSLVDDDNNCCYVFFILGRADEVEVANRGLVKEREQYSRAMVSKITLPEGED